MQWPEKEAAAQSRARKAQTAEEITKGQQHARGSGQTNTAPHRSREPISNAATYPRN